MGEGAWKLIFFKYIVAEINNVYGKRKTKIRSSLAKWISFLHSCALILKVNYFQIKCFICCPLFVIITKSRSLLAKYGPLLKERSCSKLWKKIYRWSIERGSTSLQKGATFGKCLLVFHFILLTEWISMSSKRTVKPEGLSRSSSVLQGGWLVKTVLYCSV